MRSCHDWPLLAGLSRMPRRLLGSPRHVAAFARTRLRIYYTLSTVSCEKDAQLVQADKLNPQQREIESIYLASF